MAAKVSSKDSLGGAVLVAIAIGAYLLWPRIQAFWDVKQQRMAPDIPNAEIREIYKKLEPADRRLFERYIERRRPNPSGLGDWSSKATVAEALKEEASLEALVDEVNEAKARIKVRLMHSSLYLDNAGGPALDVTIANGFSDPISKFEGKVLFFRPPLTVVHCAGIRADAQIGPGEMQHFHYSLPDLEREFDALNSPAVGIDFVPSSVTDHLGRKTVYPTPALLCQRGDTR